MSRICDVFLINCMVCSLVTGDPFAEYLCTSSTCTTSFSSGIVVSEVTSSSGSLLKKGSRVDIVGISALSHQPNLKILVNGEYTFVDSTFVQQITRPDGKLLKRFRLSLNNSPQLGSVDRENSNATPLEAPVLRHESDTETIIPSTATDSPSTLKPTLHPPDVPHFVHHIIPEDGNLPGESMGLPPENPSEFLPQQTHEELHPSSTTSLPLYQEFDITNASDVHSASLDSFSALSSDDNTVTKESEPDVVRTHHFPSPANGLRLDPVAVTGGSLFVNPSTKPESVESIDRLTTTVDTSFIESDVFTGNPTSTAAADNQSTIHEFMPAFEPMTGESYFAAAAGNFNFIESTKEAVIDSHESEAPLISTSHSNMVELSDAPRELQSTTEPSLLPSNPSTDRSEETSTLLRTDELTGVNLHSPHVPHEPLVSSPQNNSDLDEGTGASSGFFDPQSPPFIVHTESSSLVRNESELKNTTNFTSEVYGVRDDLTMAGVAPIPLETDPETAPAELFPHFMMEGYPIRPGLVQCMAWAANRTLASDSLESRSYSPLSYLVIRSVVYMFKVSDSLLILIPNDRRAYFDDMLMRTFSFSLSFLTAWVVFVMHLIFVAFSGKVFWINVKKRLGFSASVDVTVSKFIEVEERALLLANRLNDQEEVNHELAKSNAQLIIQLQNLQGEKLSELSNLHSQLDLLKEELSDVRRKLAESLEHGSDMEKSYLSRLSDATETVSKLHGEVDKLQKENAALNESFTAKIAHLKANHQKSMDDAKAEHEELYLQAVEYYNRMKSLQPEMNKLLDARKQAEDKLAATKAELDGLRKTFTTLKSFELALEHVHNGSHSSSLPTVTNDYTLVDDERTAVSSVKTESSDLQTNFAHDANGFSEESGSNEAELRASLALFLDVGHLQAELDLAKCQAKSEEAKASCERELRESLEVRLEELERETSETKAKCKMLEEDRNATQTKLDILSEYFKERELELQRDLGKHVVVGSESSEALNNSLKRNRELEAEVKAFRDQIAALRRELAETERSGRRQMTELDKRSHENWLAARAADHQIKELRDENATLRQKLLEAERAILPPALRAQQICRSQPMAPPIPLPLTALPRSTLRSGLPTGPATAEKGSVSGQSNTSSLSLPSISRVDLPFPPIPFPLPPHMSSVNSRPPSFAPGSSRLPFPHGFPPPPPPPPPVVFASQIRNAIHSPLSSNSSANLSTCSSMNYPH